MQTCDFLASFAVLSRFCPYPEVSQMQTLALLQKLTLSQDSVSGMGMAHRYTNVAWELTAPWSMGT